MKQEELQSFFDKSEALAKEYEGRVIDLEMKAPTPVEQEKVVFEPRDTKRRKAWSAAKRLHKSLEDLGDSIAISDEEDGGPHIRQGWTVCSRAYQAARLRHLSCETGPN